MGRVRDLPKATVTSTGDYLLIDGPSGTRAIPADKFSQSVGGSGKSWSWSDLIRPGNASQRNAVVRMENRGSFDSTAVNALNSKQYANVFLGDYWSLENVGKIVVGGFNVIGGLGVDHVVLVVLPYSSAKATTSSPVDESVKIGRMVTSSPNIGSLSLQKSTIKRPGGAICEDAPFFPLTIAELGYSFGMDMDTTIIPLPGIICHIPYGFSTSSMSSNKPVSLSDQRIMTNNNFNDYPVATGIIAG